MLWFLNQLPASDKASVTYGLLMMVALIAQV